MKIKQPEQYWAELKNNREQRYRCRKRIHSWGILERYNMAYCRYCLKFAYIYKDGIQ